MVNLNKLAAEIMLDYEVHACTDITGFGLLGHIYEMANGSNVTARIKASSVPLMQGVAEFAAMGIIPEGAHKNKAFYKKWVESSLPEKNPLEIILYDPQTSGGLLIAASPYVVAQISQSLQVASYGLDFAVIGEIMESGPAKIIVS